MNAPSEYELSELERIVLDDDPDAGPSIETRSRARSESNGGAAVVRSRPLSTALRSSSSHPSRAVSFSSPAPPPPSAPVDKSVPSAYVPRERPTPWESAQERRDLVGFLLAAGLAVAAAGLAATALSCYAEGKSRMAVGVPPEGLTQRQIRQAIAVRMARGGQQGVVSEMVRPLRLS